VQRKQPIIRERKNTNEDVRLYRRGQNVEATVTKTKVKVSNIKKESEDISLTVMKRSRINRKEKSDID